MAAQKQPRFVFDPVEDQSQASSSIYKISENIFKETNQEHYKKQMEIDDLKMENSKLKSKI